MIKITKKLNRPDGGTVSAGSVLDYSTTFPKDAKVVFYSISLYFNQLALDEKKPTIPAVTEFDYKMVKECTDAEWSKLNDAGSNDLVQLWLKEMLDLKLGLGNTEIV
jgi:hypothetical protein